MRVCVKPPYILIPLQYKVITILLLISIYQMVTKCDDNSCLIKMPINIVPSTYSQNQI